MVIQPATTHFPYSGPSLLLSHRISVDCHAGIQILPGAFRCCVPEGGDVRIPVKGVAFIAGKMAAGCGCRRCDLATLGITGGVGLGG